MSNRIRNVRVVNHRLDPHETELRVHVYLDEMTPDAEIRGRLVGPRNVYASTIEIAYPLREVARTDHIEMRAVIPEASWWEPRTPFLYQGIVELWQDEQLGERTRMEHGICDRRLGPRGLVVNGRPFQLRGKSVEPGISEVELRGLHHQGINALMISFDREQDWFTNAGIGSSCDRHGLFVLCRVRDDFDVSQFTALCDRVSAFGCVVPSGRIAEMKALAINQGLLPGQQLWLGIAGAHIPLPEDAAFVLCDEADPSLQSRTTATIVTTGRVPDPLPQAPHLIGWIETSSAGPLV